eukprot:m.19560 g.19560  ORF g.19560 m.19560 type:complete len:377 (+) comp7622_c1_seq1:30-1160(+)
MPPPSITVDWSGGSASFEITRGTTGQQLYDLVLGRLGLRMEPLFGLQYVDKKGFLSFIKMEKKVLSHDLQKDTHLQFLAKYYPENVIEELRNVAIQRLFWNQIRDGVCRDEIYCPPEICVLFAALTMQIESGDFDAGRHSRGFVDVNRLLPLRVFGQFSLAVPQWEEKIVNAWKSLRGLNPETGVQDYLMVAQDLEQFGVTYFEVTNKRGTRLWLGVHSLGMDVYLYSNKVTPQVGFPWHEIRNISFNDRKFRIKLTSPGNDFKFYAPRFKINKRILALCVGNHKLYLSRRRSIAQGDIVEDRAAVEAKVRETKALIAAIRSDIEVVRDTSKETAEDRLHREQERQGLDKFKTMKRAQQGDAQKRVTMFNELDSDV